MLTSFTNIIFLSWEYLGNNLSIRTDRGEHCVHFTFLKPHLMRLHWLCCSSTSLLDYVVKDLPLIYLGSLWMQVLEIKSFWDPRMTWLYCHLPKKKKTRWVKGCLLLLRQGHSYSVLFVQYSIVQDDEQCRHEPIGLLGPREETSSTRPMQSSKFPLAQSFPEARSSTTCRLMFSPGVYNFSSLRENVTSLTISHITFTTNINSTK